MRTVATITAKVMGVSASAPSSPASSNSRANTDATAAATIPRGATPPLVKPRTIDDVPVVALTLWSDAYEGFELRRVAVELKRELAALDDVSEIRVIGGERRQVRLLLDPARMAASGVDLPAVVFALEVQNAAAPAGAFEAGNRELLVETGAFLRDAAEVASLVVGVHGTVGIGEVALADAARGTALVFFVLRQPALDLVRFALQFFDLPLLRRQPIFLGFCVVQALVLFQHMAHRPFELLHLIAELRPRAAPFLGGIRR